TTTLDHRSSAYSFEFARACATASASSLVTDFVPPHGARNASREELSMVPPRYASAISRARPRPISPTLSAYSGDSDSERTSGPPWDVTRVSTALARSEVGTVFFPDSDIFSKYSTSLSLTVDSLIESVAASRCP